uniref:Cytochrome P450 83B1 n=2 Tax=Cajanus cajan TaxID=3821 RepID=A0A151RVA2_CAJCA|nr:Cytochrome P450 83B1 [Cajanus cajan]
MSPLVLVLCLTLPVFLLFFFRYPRTLKNKNQLHPPGPRGLPILGNLHQLDNSNFHVQLWQLSKKYGPLFSLQLGLRPAIVISSPKVAKEALKNHDVEFSGRPKLHGQQRLSYNGIDMSFSPYGTYWREIRKLCVVHVLSSRRVSSFSPIRHFEVKHMINKISGHASSSTVTNLNEVLISLTSAIICRTAFGRRYEDEGNERSRFHGLLNECEAMMGVLFVSDYIPFLGWVDKLTGLRTRLEKSFKELDEFSQEVIEEHMDPNRKSSEEEDIIDVLLQLKKQRSFSTDLTIDNIKAVFMDLLIAATDTTASTAVWVMTELVKHPRVMKKVQEEIRNWEDKKDFIDEDETQNFPYFKAVIKETLRLHPPLALLVPKETNKRCIIEGYEIAAKTLVYVNAWAIHRDPDTWKEPEEFLPERFLDSTIDFRGQDFELIPFGAGRRSCPGILMAIASLDLILANLLYFFDWELPPGIKKEDIDTEVLPGLVQYKKNPLCVLAKCHM